jgi:hypothetical protein
VARKNSGTTEAGGPSARKDPGSVLEERLAWVQKIGWGIATIYAAIFAGFIAWYLPKELESSRNLTKTDVESTVNPIRVDIAKLTERLRKQTAFNLESLIPPAELARVLDPAVLKARFQEANALITTAISERIPATPALLEKTQMKLQTTLTDTRLSGDMRMAATTALVGFEAYNVFSSAILVVNVPKIFLSQDATIYAPVTVDKPVWLEGTGKNGATITIDFSGPHPTYPLPAAFAIAGGSAILSKMRARGTDSAPHFLIASDQARVLVSEVAIEGLTQELGGVTWINVDFVNAIIRYNQKPTYLGNVSFKNCKFEFGSDAASTWLLDRISQQAPVTLASTAMF